MKPSQFRRIEKNALKQKDTFQKDIVTAISNRSNEDITCKKELLDNLVTTMRDLKQSK